MTRIEYGWLDDFGAVIRWTDYAPPAGQTFIIRKITPARALPPSIETDGMARW